MSRTRFLLLLPLFTGLLSAQTATPQVKSVVNEASYGSGAVCPGELVAIFGTAMGPATLVRTTVTAGAVATTVSETSVLFDGVAASARCLHFEFLRHKPGRRSQSGRQRQ